MPETSRFIPQLLPLEMSRSLVIAAFTLTALVGCASLPSAVIQPEPDVVIYSGVQQWLKQQQDVARMNAEAVAAMLADTTSARSVNEQYYHALLLQQLKDYDAWVLARNIFRQLHANTQLPEPQRQLAEIFQFYNQSRINGYQRESELRQEKLSLQQQLQNAEQDKLLLEKKIQALTDLEAVISTRKED